MKKRTLTLAIEAELLHRARVAAAARRRSLTDLVREFLRGIVHEHRGREASLRRLRRHMREKPLEVGRVRWGREEIAVTAARRARR